MAEGKIIALLSLWVAGLFGFVYSLAVIPWDDIKAIILLCIGTAASLTFLCRSVVRLIKEVYDLKQHIKNKPK